LAHPTAEYGKRDTGCFAAKNADLQTIAENCLITIPAPGLQTGDPSPIERSSRVIVSGISKAGYDVTFREFNWP